MYHRASGLLGTRTFYLSECTPQCQFINSQSFKKILRVPMSKTVAPFDTSSSADYIACRLAKLDLSH
jgi:hypothetical protein